VFESTGAGNGTDSITGFGAGGKDLMDFTAFLGAAANVDTTGTDFAAAGLSLTAGETLVQSLTRPVVLWRLRISS